MSKKVEWEYFSKRRNIDLVALIKTGQCQSYEELCSICETYKVIPPTKSEWQVCEAQALPKQNPPGTKNTKVKKPTTKKATRARKSK